MSRRFCFLALIAFMQIDALGGEQLRFSTTSQTLILVSGFPKCGIEGWGIGGAEVAVPGNVSAPIHNPAGMQMDKWIGYAELGKWASTEWLLNAKINGQWIAPSYAVIGFPLKPFHVSIGYFNEYNQLFILRSEIFTIDQPEGTGKFKEWARTKIKLHTYFGSMQYAPNEKLSIGLTLGFNAFSHFDKIGNTKAKGDGFGACWMAGIMIKPFEHFTFGYSLKYVSDIKYYLKVYEQPSQTLTIETDTTIQGNQPVRELQWDKFKYIAKFPILFETGFSYQVTKNWALYAELEVQKWRFLHEENFDVANYHLGSSISLARPFKLSFGYFTQNDSYATRWYWLEENPNDLDQRFLTVGIRADIFKSLSILGLAMDSHLLKRKHQPQKYLQSYYSAGLLIQL